MDPQRLIPGDATLIENIVNYLKAKGIFDEFRHECLADVDTKSSCQNLSQRVDGYTSKFLANETWHPDLNKNELRNKLRRNIDESGMLAVGADHVVEQVINPKIHQLFLPKIIEVVHQYVKEQSELLNKKPGAYTSTENTSTSEKSAGETADIKDKMPISDPIADILSFSYSKPKPIPASNVKTESVQHKPTDIPKVEKKKEEKINPVTEKGTPEIAIEVQSSSAVVEVKPQIDKEKEKIKKEEQEILQEVSKKAVKEEIKSEKKKSEDMKVPVSEPTPPADESKTNILPSVKPTTLSKKDFEKNKLKLKGVHSQKSSNSSSEMKKPKKESFDKSSEKHIKSKPMKSPKESPSPTKNVKSVFKEEKGETTKCKSYDSSSSKTSDSSLKKSKSTSSKKDNDSSKHKGQAEKTGKSKRSKSAEKIEPYVHHDSSNSEKGTKSIHYSSSYDSSQGSDQEKSSSSSSKKERQKHFSKHAKKEKTELDDGSDKMSVDKKRTKEGDESPTKKHKSEKDSKHKFKDTTMIEAAKISSRSNSFGSTSSVSSSSNTSKDNLVSNSDEVPESSTKDKKKKQIKEKDSCQNPSKTLPPPPPPPPPSTFLSCELTSSAEMSSVEDTQSSSNSETSSSEESNEESSSDSELESKDLILNTLNESMFNSSTDNINAFYDIFLYSSSSSEFEGYENSPEKKKLSQDASKSVNESDVTISSVHTSDLSSYDDELSSDDDVSLLTGGMKKRLTLKEAQELIQNRAILYDKNKGSVSQDKSDTNDASLKKKCTQMSSSFVSSEEESSPEPKRSLRRERKLNPRYASSEYTSIFNSRKETFITKHSSPPVKNLSLSSSPNNETPSKKIDLMVENDKLTKKSLVQNKIDLMHQNEIKKPHKNKKDSNIESQDHLQNNSEMSSSDEIDSIMDKNKLFQENNKTNDISDSDKLKLCIKLKPHNNSKVSRNSRSLKRKLEITDSTPVKRPCSRSSVDSSSSEFAPNENKPFNSEKKKIIDEMKVKDSNLKNSDLTSGIRKDLFCKQRTNNNGDLLGQKDIFSKNSHGKAINNSEKKTSDSDSSKELNSL